MMVRISSTSARFFLLFFFTLHMSLLSLATAADRLSPNRWIKDGETLLSANNLFELGFFSTRKGAKYHRRRYVGIWYHEYEGYDSPVWVANRGNPLDNNAGILTMRDDGNLAISDGIGNVMWSTNVSSPSNSSTAVLENNGNLVVREASSGAVLWESFDHPCDTLLPGMKIGINLSSGSTRMLRAWRSEDDPSPGMYAFGIDPQDQNQFFIWRGSLPYWRVIFWNGSIFKFTGEVLFEAKSTRAMPLSENWAYTASVVRDEEEVYFSPSHSIPLRWLRMVIFGGLQLYRNYTIFWSEDYIFSMKPQQRQCITDGVCGPNSSCNEDEEPRCKCLPGYKPLYPASWNSGNWQSGCIIEAPERKCNELNHYLTLHRVKWHNESSGGGLVSGGIGNASTCRQYCDGLGCDCRAYAGLVDPCYIWHEADQLTNLQEYVEDDGSGSILPELNIRVTSSVLSGTRRSCRICGSNIIPYPLSTGPNCGDPAYNSFHCNSSTGQLRFVTPDGSSYAVDGISPENRTFFIKPEGLDLCWAGCSKRSDIHLDSSLPFRVTGNNIVLLLNCSSTPQVPLNCSLDNPCYSYIQEGRAPCFYSAKCCSYIAGGSNSSTLHDLGILDSGCSSYVSIVHLDTTVNAALWKERVQIEWDAAPEPVCDAEADCDAWPYSSCLARTAEAGRKRCLCDDSYRWDPFLRNCSYYGDGSRFRGNKQKDGDHSRFSRNKLLFVSLISTGVLGTILSAAIIYCLWRKRNGKGRRKKWSFHVNEFIDAANVNDNLDVPFIDFECLVEATENFSNSNKLGKGGFGIVYKRTWILDETQSQAEEAKSLGALFLYERGVDVIQHTNKVEGTHSGGQEIAVKRLSKGSGQGLEEFKNEVVLIAKLQHRNLVRMLGYCIEGSEKMLVYEYMPNKSLDFFLFDATRRSVLDWEKRNNIIMGITRGLLYLHQDSRLRIIHRDLKTSNILLDKDMNPKISDFGMARIFGEDQIQENTNRVVGTYGYISPEYAANGLYSVKSDVYSFGIIILESISGKRNADFSQDENASSLTSYAWQLWTAERGLELMDPSLRDTYNEAQVLKCIHVGLLCVQDNASDRPTMSSVLAMLDGETARIPPPNQPAFFRGCFPAPRASSSDGMPICSNNELTISSLEAR